MADQSFLAASAQCTDGDFRNAAWCPLDPVFPLSLPPPSELHHTKEVGSRQYKEDLGGGGKGGGQTCWWR